MIVLWVWSPVSHWFGLVTGPLPLHSFFTLCMANAQAREKKTLFLTDFQSTGRFCVANQFPIFIPSAWIRYASFDVCCILCGFAVKAYTHGQHNYAPNYPQHLLWLRKSSYAQCKPFIGALHMCVLLNVLREFDARNSLITKILQRHSVLDLVDASHILLVMMIKKHVHAKIPFGTNKEFC